MILTLLGQISNSKWPAKSCLTVIFEIWWASIYYTYSHLLILMWMPNYYPIIRDQCKYLSWWLWLYSLHSWCVPNTCHAFCWRLSIVQAFWKKKSGITSMKKWRPFCWRHYGEKYVCQRTFHFHSNVCNTSHTMQVLIHCDIVFPFQKIRWIHVSSTFFSIHFRPTGDKYHYISPMVVMVMWSNSQYVTHITKQRLMILIIVTND